MDTFQQKLDRLVALKIEVKMLEDDLHGITVREKNAYTGTERQGTSRHRGMSRTNEREAARKRWKKCVQFLKKNPETTRQALRTALWDDGQNFTSHAFGATLRWMVRKKMIEWDEDGTIVWKGES